MEDIFTQDFSQITSGDGIFQLQLPISVRIEIYSISPEEDLIEVHPIPQWHLDENPGGDVSLYYRDSDTDLSGIYTQEQLPDLYEHFIAENYGLLTDNFLRLLDSLDENGLLRLEEDDIINIVDVQEIPLEKRGTKRRHDSQEIETVRRRRPRHVFEPEPIEEV